VGSLQDIFTTQCSGDIFHDAAYSKMVPYAEWNKYARDKNAVAPSPVTTIILGRSDVDQVLNNLGVIQRGRCVNNVNRDLHRVPISNTRKVPAMNKPKGLQPKDLTFNDLQELTGGDIKYQEIMEMYGFTSERYFKEIIKSLGYRLLRGELWVLEDRLWLKNQ